MHFTEFSSRAYDEPSGNREINGNLTSTDSSSRNGTHQQQAIRSEDHYYSEISSINTETPAPQAKNYPTSMISQPDSQDIFSSPDDDNHTTTLYSGMVDNVLYQSCTIDDFAISESSKNALSIEESQVTSESQETMKHAKNCDNDFVSLKGYSVTVSDNRMVDNILYHSCDFKDIEYSEISTSAGSFVSKVTQIPQENIKHLDNRDDFASRDGNLETALDSIMVANVLYQSSDANDLCYSEILPDTGNLALHVTPHFQGNMSHPNSGDDYASPDKEFF